MNRHFATLVLLAALILCFVPDASAFVWYVSSSTGSDANDGSVNQPFQTITHALATATPDSFDLIWVLRGTYSVATGESFPLVMKSGVCVQSEMGPTETIIDASGAQPRARVFISNNGGPNTIISGFTIMGGRATGSPAQGGGIFLGQGDQTQVLKNIIRDNQAIGDAATQNTLEGIGGFAAGGGIYTISSSVLVASNVITQNVATGGAGLNGSGGPGGDAEGGGAYCAQGPQLIQNTIVANSATGGTGGSNASGFGGAGGNATGGGVQGIHNSEVAITNIFSSNIATGAAGGSGSTGPGVAGSATNGAGVSRMATENHNLLYNDSPADVSFPLSPTDILGQDPQLLSYWQPLFSSPAKGVALLSGIFLNDLLNRFHTRPFSLGAYDFYSRHDVDYDRRTDIVWRNQSTGTNALWRMNGITIGNSETLEPVADLNWQIVGSGDVDGDGTGDLIWRNMATGDNVYWRQSGYAGDFGVLLPPVANLNWTVVATADFNGDGRTDVFWRNSATGDNVIWFFRRNEVGVVAPVSVVLPPVADLNWRIVGAGDLDADGKADVVWRNSIFGYVSGWLLNSSGIKSSGALPTVLNPNWRIAGLGDFQGDGKADIVWRNVMSGDNSLWFMNGLTVASGPALPSVGDTNFVMVKIGDFQGDGKADIFWRHSGSGANSVWLMNGSAIAASATLTTVSDTNWHVADRP